MPHLNVTVDGRKYSISGLTRKTCSKQILCALAKINEDIGVMKAARTPQHSNISDESGSSESGEDGRIQQDKTGEKSMKRRGWSKTEKKLLGSSGTGSKNSRLRRGSFGRNEKERSSSELASINMENLLSLIQAQRECLYAQQEELENKRGGTRQSVEKGRMLSSQQAGLIREERTEEACELIKPYTNESVKETDHDTGISEQFSDSSNETQGKFCSSVPPSTDLQSLGDATNGPEIHNGIREVFKGVHPAQASSYANVSQGGRNESFDDDPSLSVGDDVSDASGEKSNRDLFEGEGGSSSEIVREIRRVAESLASAEAKFSEQNQLIEILKNLTAHVEDSVRDQKVRNEVSKAQVQEDLEEVHKSLALSNQLYEYQKREIQENSLKLQHVESRVSRKRWHVDSLEQELKNLRLSPTKATREPGPNGPRAASAECGTLV